MIFDELEAKSDIEQCLRSLKFDAQKMVRFLKQSVMEGNDLFLALKMLELLWPRNYSWYSKTEAFHRNKPNLWYSSEKYMGKNRAVEVRPIHCLLNIFQLLGTEIGSHIKVEKEVAMFPDT
ncbi:hypothetical protein AMTR_s00198p00033320 [Amborella trichopoda]|uniref:Uncharacterized protein n=1 Tax=Amborella trichopoda TaxID=13333 RepID=U5DF61_AMBTC|nr:hypothetical protein AMTR_s00198p00033320 [Amborella trichopoda]